MGNSLIIIGKIFKLNEVFNNYIIREVKNILKRIDLITYFDNVNEIKITNVIDNSENIVILSNRDDFNKISLFLANLTNDGTKERDGMELPLKAQPYRKDSFVVEFNERLINVLAIKESEKLPEILLNSKKVDATLNIFGIDEKSSEILLSSITDEFEAEIFTYKFIDGWTKVLLKAKNFGRISQFVDRAKEILPNKIIATDNIIKYIIEKFGILGKNITFAESCTGGLLVSLFTRESGASEMLEGSLVTYSNRIKNGWLAVKNENLEDFGAVSEAVIKDMLRGVIDATNADYAIAISGVAGPSGGTKEKPVGTVFIGVKSRENNEELISRMKFNGDRNYIQEQSAYYAVMMLVEMAKDDLF